MPHYLVTAKPIKEKLLQLKQKLQQDAFIDLKPFGKALTHGLRNARVNEQGQALWEEEDYCHPPLKAEREAVLDDYFTNINVKELDRGQAIEKIQHLPYLFPEFNPN